MEYPFVNFHAHRVAEIGEKIPFSAGVHPWDILPLAYERQLQAVFDTLKQALADCRKTENMWMPLVGECGLDRLKPIDIDLQEKVFLEQILFAHRNSLPLIIHCVRSFDKLWHLHKQSRPESTWIVHGFRSSGVIAEQLQSKGILASFGAELLRTNSTSVEILKHWNEELPFFLETDDSEVSIEEIYKVVAAIQGITVDALKQKQWMFAEEILKKDK